MKLLLRSRTWYIAGAGILICLAILILIRATSESSSDFITTIAEQGSVTEVVSISGFVEAENAAELAFPVTGVVDEVLVSEGDTVTADQALILLNRAALIADWQDAYAALLRAEADRDELINGPRDESRVVTDTTVAIALAERDRIIAEQNEKVQNAERALYSGGLQAFAEDLEDDAIAPTITGTFTCDLPEGATEYTLEVFSSGGTSGYSYRLAGYETGLYQVYTDQSAPLGSCGLRIQFAPNVQYGSTNWTIPVPNNNAATYVTNRNALELTKQQAENAIAAAKQQVELAQNEATLANADPRTEALKRANAAVTSAQARVAAIDAQIEDRVIRAPFAGVITSLDVLPGESVTTNPIVTVLADDAFTMTARIPEIDITKVSVGQNADVVFDAHPEAPITATISFISPIAVEIDGVAYFEATLLFADSPLWIRSGLNADVDIMIDTATDVVRIPKRYVVTEGNTTYVLIQDPARKRNVLQQVPVTITFSGNDGFVAVDGISAGTEVVAP